MADNWIPKVDELWKVNKENAHAFSVKGNNVVDAPELLKEEPVFLVLACEPRHLQFEQVAITTIIGDHNAIIFARRCDLQKVS
jgi:hypothetical protein